MNEGSTEGGTQTDEFDNQISNYDRYCGILKIFDLHEKKEYKPESLFIAVGIFDRYLKFIGPTNFPRN